MNGFRGLYFILLFLLSARHVIILVVLSFFLVNFNIRNVCTLHTWKSERELEQKIWMFSQNGTQLTMGHLRNRWHLY